jgi:hypothetical protein
VGKLGVGSLIGRDLCMSLLTGTAHNIKVKINLSLSFEEGNFLYMDSEIFDIKFGP